MSFKIVTDSCANLTDEMIEKYDIEILSLAFYIKGNEYYSYVKGEETNLKRFYTMMRNKEAVTTSLISRKVCLDVFESILKNGQDLLYIGFSSGLSGSYHVCAATLEELQEKYPERKIYHIDSLAASLGQGLLVYYAVAQQKAGKTIEEVYNWQLENRLRLCHWFTVEDLFFLKRGGRLSATAAVFGTMLSIKPVIHVDNGGRLIPVSKVRGRKKSLEALVDRMDATAINVAEQYVFISHGDCIEDAEYVAEQIRERMNVKDVLINYIDPVIGAHSGPGTVALFFIGSER